MKKIKSELVKQAQKYVMGLLQEKLPAHVVYHNAAHTKEVAEAALEIGEAEGLSEEDLEMVVLAALFHDTGHTVDAQAHEEHSKAIAGAFLHERGFPIDKIEQVQSVIDATKMPQSPQNVLQQVMCDADLRHLASKDFEPKSELLRQEWKAEHGRVYTDEEWIAQNIAFLRSHSYFTAYGQSVLESEKQLIIKSQKKALKKLKEKQDDFLMRELQVDESELKELRKQLGKIQGRPERGVETMFRTTSRNHLDLSSMADSKANIMISVNSIIISIIVGALSTKLDTNPHLLLPMALLLFSCLAAMTFAILATRPNVTSGKFSREDIEAKRANLLFFGNFHNMRLPDFEWGMNQLINDSDYLYGSLIRDIYFLGVVLGKKYRLLRISYTVFMFGLIVSVLAFVVALSSSPTLNTF
jgi:predicted metal-dependent HD superfamily phosphohydrolase